jgi:hypothetical protein
MIGYYSKEWQSLAPSIVNRWCPSFTGNTQLQLPDVSGFGRHGTLFRYANNGNDSYRVNAEKTALYFNGVTTTGNYVGASTSADLTTTYTVSYWIYPDSTGGLRSALTKGTTAGINDLEFYLRPDFVVLHNRGNGGTTSGVSFPTLTTSRWTHMLFNYDVQRTGSNRWQGFYDGRSQTSAVIVGQGQPPLDTTSTVFLGANFNSAFSSQIFLGLLDDVIIFNRVVTEPEARFIFEQGRGGGLLYEPPRRKTYFVPPIAGWKSYWFRSQQRMVGGGIR